MSETIYNAIAWMLIHAVWQISLIALIVYFIIHSGLIKNTNRRFLTITMGIGTIALMALITFIFYYQGATEPGVDHLSQLPGTVSNPSSNYNGTNSWFTTWLEKNLIFLTIAWISGFFIYSTKLIGGLAYLGIIRNKASVIQDPVILTTLQKLLTKTGRRRKITVYLSEKVFSPVTFGLYRLSIVFPVSYINQLSMEETEIILAHEISHIIRYDYLVNLLMSIVKTFFYFHPGIWWLNNRLEIEREKATDELACKICKTQSLNYAKTLLKAQELSQELKQTGAIARPENALALPFWKSKNQLLNRVEHLLGANQKKNPWFHRLVTLLLFLGLFSLLSFTQIILPRNGAMVHPAMEAEAMTQEENILIERTSDENLT